MENKSPFQTRTFTQKKVLDKKIEPTFLFSYPEIQNIARNFNLNNFSEDLILFLGNKKEFSIRVNDKEYYGKFKNIENFNNLKVYYLKPVENFYLSLPISIFNIKDDYLREGFIHIFENILSTRINLPVNHYFSSSNIIFSAFNFHYDEFEKSELGIFLFLSYIKKINTSDVCFPISPIEPLLNTVKNIFDDLIGNSFSEFIRNEKLKTKYPRLNVNRLNTELEKYLTNSITKESFILAIIREVLFNNSPYIKVIPKNRDLDCSQPQEDNYKINISETFKKLFQRCLQSDAKYVIIPVSFQVCSCKHMNILFLDKNKKEVERFEPNGSRFYEAKNCPSEFLDQELTNFFEEFKFQYIRPNEFCPYYGPQSIEHEYQGGFCITWSFLYAMERLGNPSRKLTSTNMTKNIIERAKKFVYETDPNLINKKMYDFDFVMRYFEDRLAKILESSNTEIEKINQLFGTNLKIDERILL
jgi:hypothetical protein